MKKRVSIISILITMLLSMNVFSATLATYVYPSLSFNGNTATCSAVIRDYGKTIDADMELWCGTTLVDSWSGSGTSSVVILGNSSVSKGKTYTLKVSGKTNNVAFTSTSISVRCE